MELVLLTGVSGFIAKHIALKLLNAGFNVRGTLRRLDRADEVRAALAPYLTEHAGQISFPGGRIDPSDKDAWDAALRETEEEIGLAAPPWWPCCCRSSSWAG